MLRVRKGRPWGSAKLSKEGSGMCEDTKSSTSGRSFVSFLKEIREIKRSRLYLFFDGAGCYLRHSQRCSRQGLLPSDNMITCTRYKWGAKLLQVQEAVFVPYRRAKIAASVAMCTIGCSGSISLVLKYTLVIIARKDDMLLAYLACFRSSYHHLDRPFVDGQGSTHSAEG